MPDWHQSSAEEVLKSAKLWHPASMHGSSPRRRLLTEPINRWNHICNSVTCTNFGNRHNPHLQILRSAMKPIQRFCALGSRGPCLLCHGITMMIGKKSFCLGPLPARRRPHLSAGPHPQTMVAATLMIISLSPPPPCPHKRTVAASSVPPSHSSARVGSSRAPKSSALSDNCANLCLANKSFIERVAPAATVHEFSTGVDGIGSAKTTGYVYIPIYVDCMSRIGGKSGKVELNLRYTSRMAWVSIS